MITLGKEIISLRERFGAPWSEFAFVLRYPRWGILLHSLTSKIIVCNEKTTKRVLANKITKRDKAILQKARLMTKSDVDDERLRKGIFAKVQRHLDKASVTTLLLVVTDSCNLCCKYCFENLGRFSKSRAMDLHKMIEAVDYFLALDTGEKSVFFYGGEPLIRWKNIKSCVEYIRTRYKNRKVNIQITTNGTIHPDDLVRFCKRNKVDVGVSIDGPSEITNSVRLSKTKDLDVFESSFQLVKDCREAGLKYAVLCTISNESAKYLEKITDFFIGEKIAGLGFNLNVKRAGESVQEDLSFWDDFGRRMSVQYQKLLAHGIPEPRGLRYLRGIAESRFTVAECDAGYRGQIVVNPDGLIGPCQAFLHDPDFWIPMQREVNIREHSLWKKFSYGTVLEIDSCKGCPFMGTCGGGCRYNRNDFERPNPNFCQYIRSFTYHTLASFERR